jgi:hypothetical protein
MALTAPQIIDRDARGIAAPGSTRDDVMTASEVAALLRLPVSTVHYLPATGRSHVPVGRRWRFLRPRIEAVLTRERARWPVVSAGTTWDDLGLQHPVRGVYAWNRAQQWPQKGLRQIRRYRARLPDGRDR